MPAGRLIFVVCALTAPTLYADVVYDTLGMVSDQSYDGVHGNAIGGRGVFGTTYDLQACDDFSIALQNFAINELDQASVCYFGSAPADLAIRIYPDVNGIPGENPIFDQLAIGDLGGTLSATEFDDEQFGFAGLILSVRDISIPLDAGRYWIDLQPVDESKDADWYYQLSSTSGVEGGSLHLRDGKSGYPGNYGFDQWTNSGDEALALRIAGAVPEPSALLTLSFAVVFVARRRR